MALPCDSAGVCMRCKVNPPAEECVTCGTCITPWHVPCLSTPIDSVDSTVEWKCPDCSGDVVPVIRTPSADGGPDGLSLVAKIRAIEADETLSEAQKAKMRQRLLSGRSDDKDEDENNGDSGDDIDGILDILRQNMNCAICLQLAERPITTPCGHNFCLRCFEKWVGRQRKFTCVKCRASIPKKIAKNPRINPALVAAIRLASVSTPSGVVSAKVYHHISNKDLPDKAFTSKRAKKSGKANAKSGKIFVTIPSDHFGPIPAESDPIRNQGVLVGESWGHRLDCRQWGVHFPTVSGIAGQKDYGAQSVTVSGGYLDDEDHGEWFLYTGSGGRDLRGNKRTNKNQSFDQQFANYNEALRISCQMGYPVRVVRSVKEKRSAYAPVKGFRYDGVYRIEKCWRKVGVQGIFKVCRYLFVRCDNEPAPWTSDAHGDRLRPLPNVPELNNALDLFERTESPSWDFDDAQGCWRWMKPPPTSRIKRSRKVAKKISIREKIMKEFSCQICGKVMDQPVTTPCAHNFCKACIESIFAGIPLLRQRSRGGRTLRAQKNIMTCPCCPSDLAEFLENPQVNREMMDVIEKLKKKEEPVGEETFESNSGEGEEAEEEEGEDEEEDEEEEDEEEEEEEEEEDDEEGDDEDNEGEEKEIQTVVSEDEPLTKKMKLDTDAAETTTMVGK